MERIDYHCNIQPVISSYSKLILIVLTLLFSQLAYTQEEDSITDGFVLKEVIIQGERLQIPFSQQNRDIVVLEAEVIEHLPAQSLNELLNYVAGVDIKQRGPLGGQSDININGGTFDQTLILVNGIKIIDPQTGHNMMNLPISTSSIKRIEILKGAAASAFGINALNGAINIITKQPDGNGFFVQVNSGSSFEKDTSNQRLYGSIGVELNTHFSFEKVKNFLAVSTMQSSGHRYNTALNNNKIFYSSKIGLKRDDKLNIMTGYIYNEFGANGFYAPPGDLNSKEKVQTALASISGDFQLKEKWWLRPSVSYRNNHDHYMYNRNDALNNVNNHTTNSLDVSLNNSIQSNIGAFGIGVEYRNEWINSNSLGEWHRGNWGVFAEYSYVPIDDLSIHAGIYLNYSKHFGWNLLPSLDIGYQLNPHWRWYANVGTGLRTPTYTDWYYAGPTNIGNSDLTPENAISIESGLKYNYQQLHVNVNYFHRITNDFIDWVKDSIQDPWQPQNFQRIKIHGLSVSADYHLRKPSNEKGIHVIAGISYTFLQAQVKNNEQTTQVISRYALNHLKNQFIARVNLGFLKNYHFTLAGKVEQRIDTKAYFLMDAKLSGQWQGFQANISCNNITNTTYYDFITTPLAGRWLTLGLSYQL